MLGDCVLPGAGLGIEPEGYIAADKCAIVSYSFRLIGPQTKES